MQQPSLASAEPLRPARDRHGVIAGVVAGVIALGCCVGPAAAALVGITSATVAIDLATNLYGTWGWAFKLAGLAFAAVAVGVSVRQRRACGVDANGWRTLGIVALAGLLTYALLYVGTTWLGMRA